jgi:hypothetical protein
MRKRGREDLGKKLVVERRRKNCPRISLLRVLKGRGGLKEGEILTSTLAQGRLHHGHAPHACRGRGTQ